MGKVTIFMIFMWAIVAIAGSAMQGSNPFGNTALTAAVSDTEVATINVVSTEGFADSGFVTILEERISYPARTATTFNSSFLHNLGRGSTGTDATEHVTGEIVRTVESGMLNQSLQYQIATLTDSAGVIGFVTLPFRLLQLLITFVTLPVSFFGTDLAIIGYLWAILSIGVLVSFGLSIVGGRRMA